MRELKSKMQTEKGKLMRQDAIEAAKKELTLILEAKYHGDMLKEAEKNARNTLLKAQVERTQRAAQEAIDLADSMQED